MAGNGRCSWSATYSSWLTPLPAQHTGRRSRWVYSCPSRRGERDMAGVNKGILVGNLGADPEARSLNNGGEFVNMRVPPSEQWKDRDGNRQERTEWHNVVIFNENLGRVAKSYLRKGSKVYLEGQIQTRKWTDQTGNDRYTTEVVLQKFRGELVLLDSREVAGGGSGAFSEDFGDAGEST